MAKVCRECGMGPVKHTVGKASKPGRTPEEKAKAKSLGGQDHYCKYHAPNASASRQSWDEVNKVWIRG